MIITKCRFWIVNVCFLAEQCPKSIYTKTTVSSDSSGSWLAGAPFSKFLHGTPVSITGDLHGTSMPNSCEGGALHVSNRTSNLFSESPGSCQISSSYLPKRQSTFSSSSALSRYLSSDPLTMSLTFWLMFWIMKLKNGLPAFLYACMESCFLETEVSFRAKMQVYPSRPSLSGSSASILYGWFRGRLWKSGPLAWLGWKRWIWRQVSSSSVSSLLLPFILWNIGTQLLWGWINLFTVKPKGKR